MTSVLSDLKHGLRVLLRTPLFTFCTIAALAIGIGSTTALFSVVHALLIRPLPYQDAESLVVMWEHNLPRNRPRNVISPANFLEWRERSRTFDAMAAFSQNRVTLTGSGEPQELATADRDGQHARRARRVADPRPRIRERRGSRGRGTHDDPVARGVASSVWRQHRRHRKPGHDQRRAGRHHRRDAALVRDLRPAG